MTRYESVKKRMLIVINKCKKEYSSLAELKAGEEKKAQEDKGKEVKRIDLYYYLIKSIADFTECVLSFDDVYNIKNDLITNYNYDEKSNDLINMVVVKLFGNISKGEHAGRNWIDVYVFEKENNWVSFIKTSIKNYITDIYVSEKKHGSGLSYIDEYDDENDKPKNEIESLVNEQNLAEARMILKEFGLTLCEKLSTSELVLYSIYKNELANKKSRSFDANKFLSEYLSEPYAVISYAIDILIKYFGVDRNSEIIKSIIANESVCPYNNVKQVINKKERLEKKVAKFEEFKRLR